MRSVLIIYNARIHTQDQRLPLASAIAIDVQNGRILAVGEDEFIVSEFNTKHDKYDAQQRAIIPGLTDAHIHLQQYALGLEKIDCETETRDECVRRVEKRVKDSKPGEWILGHGWNQNNWSEGFGNAAILDQVSSHNPIYLTAKSLHAAWANSEALKRAVINMETLDPPGGRIGRDHQGKPDGILFESAMKLITDVIPAPTVEEIARAIGNAQPALWSMGLTGVHDFDRQPCFSALQILHERGELGLRVLKSIPLEALPHAVEIGLRSGFGDNYLRIGGIKIFADGALGPRTAAMIQHFENEPNNRGMLLMDAEEIYEHGRIAVQNGFSLAVHAIGDRANHEVLDAFMQLREVESHNQLITSRRKLRHRIEHVQLIHPHDAGRLAQLGVVASMQPIHATSDMAMADRFWGERAAYSYAWKEQLNHGVKLAFGSDAPVEAPNPFLGLHAAVTRRREDGSPGPDGWYPEQRLTLEQALHGFTTGAAYAAGMEDRLGKLSAGYMADLLILDQDLFFVDPDEMRFIQPTATMIAGQWAWQTD